MNKKGGQMQIQSRSCSRENFTGHGARNIGQVMNRLYESAYKGDLFEEVPDIIQVSAKMKDGTNVSAIANFFNGKFAGLRFPFEHVQYKGEFCKTIMQKFNKAITRGKIDK